MLGLLLALLAAPGSATATVPGTVILTGTAPTELARDSDNNFYFTDKPTTGLFAGKTILAISRHVTEPLVALALPSGSEIGDVGFDQSRNAYFVTNQPGAQPNTQTSEIRKVFVPSSGPFGADPTTPIYTTSSTSDSTGTVTVGERIDMIEPGLGGDVYYAAATHFASGPHLTINHLPLGETTPETIASYPTPQGGATPSSLSLSLSLDGSKLAWDVSGGNAVYLWTVGSGQPPKLITTQPTGRALGWDSFGDLYVMARTFANATSTFCADSTTFTVLRFTPQDLASANPTGSLYGRGTFPGRDFILGGSSTDTRVSPNGDVFFAIDQADCRVGGTLYVKTRRLLGVPAGGGVPMVLDEDVTDPATTDYGPIGIALGPTNFFRSSPRLGNIESFPLSGLSPPFDWAAQNLVDFDGNQVAELGALYRGRSPQDSLWFAPGTFSIYFGATSDVPVPGDYNGDGRTDAVIFRPSTGLWYGPATGLSQIVIQQVVGQAGDIPIPGDYDGDGKTDPAIYRPSTGMFFAVLSGGGTKSSTFGAPNDVPVPRDYDGDGKTDFGIYRQDATPSHLSLWYAPVSGGEAPYQIYFGAPGDIPIPGDYNGDRRAEAMIFRESTGLWYGPYNNGGSGVLQFFFGGPGDVPIPGYYDADRNMDPAIYHKSTGFWFALLSLGGTSRIDGLGQPTDVPIQKRPALAGGL